MFKDEGRPKIDIPRTKSEWIWDIVGYSFYLGSIVFLLYNWSAIPEKVPAHFDALGEVDRWGNKMELFVLPIIGLITGVFMTHLEKKPETYNYPKNFKKENAKEFYLLGRKQINQTKNVCLMLFSAILIRTTMIALGKVSGLGTWFLPITVIAVLLPIIVVMIKQRKIK